MVLSMVSRSNLADELCRKYGFSERQLSNKTKNFSLEIIRHFSQRLSQDFEVGFEKVAVAEIPLCLGLDFGRKDGALFSLSPPEFLVLKLPFWPSRLRICSFVGKRSSCGFSSLT